MRRAERLAVLGAVAAIIAVAGWGIAFSAGQVLGHAEADAGINFVALARQADATAEIASIRRAAEPSEGTGDAEAPAIVAASRPDVVRRALPLPRPVPRLLFPDAPRLLTADPVRPRDDVVTISKADIRLCVEVLALGLIVVPLSLALWVHLAVQVRGLFARRA